MGPRPCRATNARPARPAATIASVTDDKTERRREALNVVRNLVASDAAPLERSQLGTALVSYLQGSCDDDFVTFLVRERLLSDDTAVEYRGHTATFEPVGPSAFGETLRTLGLLALERPAPLPGAATLPDTMNLDDHSIHVVGRQSVLFSGGTFADRVRSLSDDATETATHLAAVPQERYQAKTLIGLGGMGEVYEVSDVDLNRPVALKRIRADRNDPTMLARFLLEAQVTAQLEHPHIVPVHDFGRLSDGAPFFTMKRVEGTTLRDVIRKLASGDAETVQRYDLTRLAITFLHVVEAVAYAHARGVVHCDLKPENILLGRHGEVLVSDWGMVQLVGEQAPSDRTEVPVSLLPGTRMVPSGGGTLLYMAPEQVTGQVIDERTDVYALGAVLYEMLTLKPPHDARDHGELLVMIFSEPLISPRERAPDREVPLELEAVCKKALHPRAADRFARADDMRVAVEAYLTGARRRETARERHAEGEAAYARWRTLSQEREQLCKERDKLAVDVKPYDGEAKKRPLWEAEERLYALDIALEEALVEALDGWSQAVGIDSGFVAASDRLADVHLELFLQAEREGDRRQMYLNRRQVERHHRGRHAGVLSGRGSVTLLPTSDDVRIELHRFEERGKRMVRGERILLDARRLEDLSLPMGSYLFTLRSPGGEEASLPVLVGRGSRTVLRPRVLEKALVPPGFLHVPAGSFLYGGDKDALNAGPREERHVDDFLIARHPVTCQEYAAFLNALVDESPHLAERHVPRTKPDGGYLWAADETGRYAVPRLDADGNPGHPLAPVMGVSFVDAQAYASWRATKENRAYRLPHEHEWEKAARGADGRFFPWGNGFDPTFCKMALSRPGRPQPEPVGSFPVDTSVYGMTDCAGAIREWCDDFYDDSRETRVLRGGAWYFNPSYCRLCFRHGYLPHIVFTNFGIRLAMSV